MSAGDASGVLTVDVAGLAVPVLDTDDGPLVFAAEMPAALSPLGSVVNAAAAGALPGLANAVARRETLRGAKLSARPAEAGDAEQLGEPWADFTGSPPGDDAYLLSEDTRQRHALVPRDWLLAALEVFADRTPLWRRETGPERQDELEALAATVDASAGAEQFVERRRLLGELEATGALEAPGLDRARWPLLAAYADAAEARRAYATSWQREEHLGEDAGPPAVSLDWFRFGAEVPVEDADPWSALAWAESALRAAETGDGGFGEVRVHADGRWVTLRWRRDDGSTPVLVDARAG